MDGAAVMDALTWSWISAALQNGPDAHLTREHIEGEIAANRAQLWRGDRGVGVTQLVNAEGRRFVHVWLAGGAMEELLALRAGVEAWGRQMGCKTVSINGRPGWARVLKPFGYRLVDGEVQKTL